MIEQQDPAIKKASSVLDYLANDEETMRLYELREKAIHDEVTRMNGARAEGIKEGIKEGRKEGIKEGTKKVALSLLSQNISIDIIKNATGLTEEEIQLLRDIEL